MMEKFIIWSLLSYGLTNIMVYGKIFLPLRDFIGLWSKINIVVVRHLGMFINGIISCVMCFSTWSGFFLSLFIYSPINDFFGIHIYESWFYDGILSSGIVWAINSIIEWFENKK
jgi:hypothetical protein